MTPASTFLPPAPESTLVGREPVFDDLNALLKDECRLVTLWGPGGIGKTRMAIELAHRTQAKGKRVIFVDLTDVRGEAQVCAALVRALGLSASANNCFETTVETISSALKDTEDPLLIIDHFDAHYSEIPKMDIACVLRSHATKPTSDWLLIGWPLFRGNAVDGNYF